MGNRTQPLMGFLQQTLAVLATCSALVYYWGYLSLNSRTIHMFGVKLPFPVLDYWDAGLQQLIPIGILFGIGAALGISRAVKNPDLNPINAIILGVTLFSTYIFYTVSDYATLSDTPRIILTALSIPGIGCALSLLAFCVVHLFMIFADQEEQVERLGKLLSEQEARITDRLNEPSILHLKAGSSTEVLQASFHERGTDILLSRIDQAQAQYNVAMKHRRSARLNLAAMTIFTGFIVAVLFPVTSRFVSITSPYNGGPWDYPAVKLVTAHEVPELGNGLSEGVSFVYYVHLFLQSDGQVYVLNTYPGCPGTLPTDKERDCSAILPASDIVRIIPDIRN